MKEIPYIKQRATNTCGPVAIYNAILWSESGGEPRLGARPRPGLRPGPSPGLRTLIKACDPHWRFGTPQERITRILKEELKDTLALDKVIEYPTLADIQTGLGPNRCIILEFHAADEGIMFDHYVLLFKHNDGKIKIVNNGPAEPVVQNITLQKLELEFLQRFRYMEPGRFSGAEPHFDESNRNFPRIWVLSRQT